MDQYCSLFVKIIAVPVGFYMAYTLKKILRVKDMEPHM